MSGQHAHGCERRSNHERQGNEHRPPLDAQAEAAGAAVLLHVPSVCAQGWAHGSKAANTRESLAGRSTASIDLTSTGVRRSARSGFLPHGPESWDAAKLGVDDRLRRNAQRVVDLECLCSDKHTDTRGAQVHRDVVTYERACGMRQVSMLMRAEQPTMHRSIARRVAWCGMHTVRYVHGVALHQSLRTNNVMGNAHRKQRSGHDGKGVW